MRLISSLLIVLVHSEVVTASAGLSDSAESFLRFGTDLFLVCSAFLTAFVMSRSTKTPEQFIVDRTARVVPLYWLMTAAVAALALVKPDLFKSTVANAETILKSLFFVPYLKGSGKIQPIVFVAWTLNYIMLFAAIYFAAMKLAGRDRAPLAAAGMLLALVAGGLVTPDGWAPWDFYTSPILLDLVWGLAAFLILKKVDRVGTAALAALAVIAAALLIARPLFWDFEILWRSIGNGAPCAALLLAAIWLERSGTRLFSPKLNIFAEATFAVYLTHYFVSQVANKLFARAGDVHVLVGWLGVGAVLGVSMAVGLVMYLYVERPLTARVNTWLASYRHRLAPATA